MSTPVDNERVLLLCVATPESDARHWSGPRSRYAFCHRRGPLEIAGRIARARTPVKQGVARTNLETIRDSPCPLLSVGCLLTLNRTEPNNAAKGSIGAPRVFWRQFAPSDCQTDIGTRAGAVARFIRNEDCDAGPRPASWPAGLDWDRGHRGRKQAGGRSRQSPGQFELQTPLIFLQRALARAPTMISAQAHRRRALDG